ncbi:MAG: pyridoxal-phosphate dependent enzyme [Bacteroidia bacterium]
MNFEVAKVLNKINDPMFSDREITLYVKREDLVHPVYGGNKFRKLKYNLIYARENNFDTLWTFGGAFSNHIAATAYAGKKLGVKTIGVIRGDELKPSDEKLSKTLREAKANGMQLKFISRSDYKRKYDDDFLNELRNEFGNAYIIPEGGSNEFALQGCREIVDDIEIDFDYIICPVGTGTTLLGIASGLKPYQTAVGIEVYKNENPQEENLEFLKHHPLEIKNYKLRPDSYRVENYSFGGYGKSTPELDTFCKDFSTNHNITIEPVYTGKMFYGIFDLVKQGYFPKASIIVAIHTGGLQYI